MFRNGVPLQRLAHSLFLMKLLINTTGYDVSAVYGTSQSGVVIYEFDMLQAKEITILH